MHIVTYVFCALVMSNVFLNSPLFEFVYRTLTNLLVFFSYIAFIITASLLIPEALITHSKPPFERVCTTSLFCLKYASLTTASAAITLYDVNANTAVISPIRYFIFFIYILLSISQEIPLYP